MRYILDCSVAVKWFVPEPDSDIADTVLDRCLAGEVTFIAPESIVAELGHSLRKAVVGKERNLSVEDSHRFVDEFLGYPVSVVPISPLASQAMRLTTLHMSTFYDALYMSLAIREDLKILTADRRMASAFARLDRTAALSSLRQP